jgi:integrase
MASTKTLTLITASTRPRDQYVQEDEPLLLPPVQPGGEAPAFERVAASAASVLSAHPPTLAALLDLYERDSLPAKALKTQYQERLVFRQLRTEYGTLPLAAITPEWLRSWRDRFRQRRLTSGTIRQYMTYLSTVLTVAVNEYEWLPAHPMRKVRLPSSSPIRVRFLSPEERERLFAACHASRNRHLYLIVLVGLTTGARKTEILRLQWQDIDLVQGYLSLALTKNGVGRSVAIPQMTLDILARHAQPRGLLFPGPNGRRPVRIEQAWVTAKQRAGLKDFRFHDLRHTFASYLAMSGASLIEIAEALGHKSMQMVRRYAHLTPAHTKGVVERMTQQFLGDATPEGAPYA